MQPACRAAYRLFTAANAASIAKETAMTTSRTDMLRLGAVAAAVAAALSLAACNRADEPTAGQRVDGAVADAKQAAQEAKQAGAQAADTVKDGAMDATITTKINAALAADDKLSAIKIDVDTRDGRVTLNGSAPDAVSRERATTLAAAVEGVSSVDNRLAVKSN
jgi:osmotically-inducible protein OsmY